MVSVTTLILSLSGVCVLAVIVGYWGLRRGRAVSVGGLDHVGPAQPTRSPTQLVDPEVTRMLSERLAVLEGRLPAMQQVLDGYGAVTIRLREIEGSLPALADAYTKFQQMTLNMEKRHNERERQATNKAITVEAAAAEAGMAASGLPPQIGMGSHGGPSARRGVLGGNGQRSAKK